MRASEGHVEFLGVALDHWEAWIQRSCRSRFGVYDPGRPYQAEFIDRLRSLQHSLEAA